MKTFFVSILLIAASGYHLYGQNFKIGMAIESDDVALKHRLTLLLHELSPSLKQHTATADELNAYMLWQEDVARSKVLLALIANHHKQDLERLNENANGTTLEKLQEQEKLLNKQLSKISAEQPPEIWPIEWDKTNYDGFSEELALSHPNTTFWLYGSLTELRPGLIYINFNSYNSLTHQRQQLYNGSVRTESLEQAASSIIEKSAGEILGRDWGSIIITGDLKNSIIILDGEKIASPKDLSYLPPGEYHLKIEKSGYHPFDGHYKIEPKRTTTLAYHAEFDKSQPSYYITSEPTGAQIFIDGNYIGLTPMVVEAGERQLLSIHSKTFKSLNYALDNQYNLFFKLEPIGLEKNLAKNQQWFYATYSIFIISLSLPVIFFSLRENALYRAVAYSSNGQIDQANAWRKKATTYGYVGGATSGLSALFLGVSLSRLYYYVKSQDQTPHPL